MLRILDAVTWSDLKRHGCNRDSANINIERYRVIRAYHNKVSSNKCIAGGLCMFIEITWTAQINMLKRMCTKDHCCCLYLSDLQSFYGSVQRGYMYTSILCIYIHNCDYYYYYLNCQTNELKTFLFNLGTNLHKLSSFLMWKTIGGLYGMA